MSVFRRRRSESEESAPEHEAGTNEQPTEQQDVELENEQASDAADTDSPQADESPDAPAATARRDDGPHDVTEVDDEVERLDLGALQISPVEGVEIRVEVEDGTAAVQGVTFVADGTALQVNVFAAPRTEGIWDEVRTEIASSITSSGGTADHADGEFGTELQANVTGEDEKGRPATQPVRFIGVDGPRWFLRGLISGAGATDPAAATHVVDAFRGLVVVRGEDPMAPHEPLTLTLPSDALQAGEEESEDDGHDPFTRGPEITEIR